MESGSRISLMLPTAQDKDQDAKVADAVVAPDASMMDTADMMDAEPAALADGGTRSSSSQASAPDPQSSDADQPDAAAGDAPASTAPDAETMDVPGAGGPVDAGAGSPAGASQEVDASVADAGAEKSLRDALVEAAIEAFGDRTDGDDDRDRWREGAQAGGSLSPQFVLSVLNPMRRTAICFDQTRRCVQACLVIAQDCEPCAADPECAEALEDVCGATIARCE